MVIIYALPRFVKFSNRFEISLDLTLSFVYTMHSVNERSRNAKKYHIKRRTEFD
jgi:hypothetical protein